MISEVDKIRNEQCKGRITRGVPKDAKIIYYTTKIEVDKLKSYMLD